jgi:pyruvate carboxylase subunit A
MLAKLIVWAPDWVTLLARSERVLTDIRLFGIRTTIPYYMNILAHPEFRDANFNTGFIAANPQLAEYSMKKSPSQVATVIAAALASQHNW